MRRSLSMDLSIIPRRGSLPSRVRPYTRSCPLPLNSGPGVAEAMGALVEAITVCRFEVTDQDGLRGGRTRDSPGSWACFSPACAATALANRTCLRLVQQAGTKGELLQRSPGISWEKSVNGFLVHKKCYPQSCVEYKTQSNSRPLQSTSLATSEPSRCSVHQQVKFSRGMDIHRRDLLKGQ